MPVQFEILKFIASKTCANTGSAKAAQKALQCGADTFVKSSEAISKKAKVPRGTGKKLQKFLKVQQYRIDKVEDPEIREILTKLNNCGKSNRMIYGQVSRYAGKTAEYYETLSPEMKELVASRLKTIRFNAKGEIKGLKSLQNLEEARILANIEPEVNGIYRAGDNSASKILKQTIYTEGTVGEKTIHAVVYDNNLRFNSLKKYIELYDKKNPELCNKLYGKYYLTSLDKETSKILSDIHKDFGAKTFLFDSPDISQADYIYKELAEYVRASEGKAKLPEIIEVNRYAYNKFTRGEAAGVHMGRIPHIAIESADDLEYALRHEIMHGNHGHTGLEEMVKQPVVWFCEALDLYKEPMLSAGIEPAARKYAYKNYQETLSVAAQGDMSAYPAWFKKFLKFIGMPKWAFNMEKNPGHVNTTIEKLRSQFDELINSRKRLIIYSSDL